MTRRWLYVCAACLVAGAAAAYCYQGAALRRTVTALDARYAEARRADSAAARLDAARTDTVTQIRVVVRHDSAAADTQSGYIRTRIGNVRLRLADSARAAFDSLVTAFAARDSLRLRQIAGLNAIVAIQDSQMTALRGRLSSSSLLLGDAMRTVDRLNAQLSRRWHLTVSSDCGGISLGLRGEPVYQCHRAELRVSYEIF